MRVVFKAEESRWGNGVLLRVHEDSGEPLIGPSEGVIKVRTIRRRVGAAWWEKRLFDALLAAEPRLQVSLAIFCLYLKTKHIHNYTTIKIVVYSYIY